jgi:hypothetical protein
MPNKLAVRRILMKLHGAHPRRVPAHSISLLLAWLRILLRLLLFDPPPKSKPPLSAIHPARARLKGNLITRQRQPVLASGKASGRP